MEPGCQIADLPPIDLVILSHYHRDDFDDVAAQELDKKLPIVSTADAVDKLSALGFKRGHSLDTWESLEVHKGDATLNITAMPAKHATDETVNALLMPVNGHCSTSAGRPSALPGRHHRDTMLSIAWMTSRALPRH